MSFVKKSHDGLEWMCSDAIAVPHGFTTRKGGVSRGIYESLNLRVHSEDDPENIAENYSRTADALKMPFDRLVRSHQVHKDDIVVADESHVVGLFDPIPYDADGLITNIPHLPLMIYVADCIPLLLHDTDGAIGAIHCGWRSTVLDTPGKAVRLMGERFGTKPENICAAIGAGISQCCFETGGDVADGVRAVLNGGGDEFIYPQESGKYKVDLKGVVRQLLIRAGLAPSNIDINSECTMCLNDKYWSHRYTNGKRGLQAAVIALE